MAWLVWFKCKKGHEDKFYMALGLLLASKILIYGELIKKIGY
jgi:hypothetical protein